MILFTNLKEVTVNQKTYNPIPVLKLTSDKELPFDKLTLKQHQLIDDLKLEEYHNNIY